MNFSPSDNPSVAGTSTAPSAPVLQACGVSAGYQNHLILQSLDLSIHRGEIYALLGANGAGKTTTLSLFLGFISPLSGQVRVNGINPVSDASEARRHIAYIPENVALYEQLTAYENIAYLLDLAGQRECSDTIYGALTAAGLEHSAIQRRAGGFSKGMRQKIVIALALARKVPALLLDEPTSGLDPQATADFNHLLDQLRSRDIAVLMVTHDLLSAADVADRIGFLETGHLQEETAATGNDRFDVRALHHRYSKKARP